MQALIEPHQDYENRNQPARNHTCHSLRALDVIADAYGHARKDTRRPSLPPFPAVLLPGSFSILPPSSLLCLLPSLSCPSKTSVSTYFFTKTAAISTIFPHFLHFPPSFPLVDKKVSDFAVLYSVENQDISVGLPIQCLKASHSLLPRASYSTFNELILYPSYFCSPTDMENVHIRLSLFLESSSWLK